MKELLYALLVIMNALNFSIGGALLLEKEQSVFNGWLITWVINYIGIAFLCWYLIWRRGGK